jgi:hypothetical protein
MFVQQGCFTVHSNQTPLNKREGREQYLGQIIIRLPLSDDWHSR